MAYNAVCQRDQDAHSDAASNNSEPPDSIYKKSPRPLSLNTKSLPQSRKMSDASRGSYTPLKHPTPGLEALQGAYISNIERLEQSAERLSQSGSDIGEELRKLKLEQKKSESRRSSIYNRYAEDTEVFSPPARRLSYGYGSAANSIVETNSIARSGGFSPAGYVPSPRGSISGSWSHHNSVRGRSGSNGHGLRVTQLAEIRDEIAAQQQSHPLPTHIAPILPPPQAPTRVLRVTNTEEGQPERNAEPFSDSKNESVEHNETTPQRPASADTFQQARDLFDDFDGVHIGSQSPEPASAPPVLSNEPLSANPRRASRPISYMEPLPGENMVFYPAPVPMMLNLPQKLSKLPAAPHRDKRRSQILGELQPQARKSAPWLPHHSGKRRSLRLGTCSNSHLGRMRSHGSWRMCRHSSAQVYSSIIQRSSMIFNYKETL